MPYNVSQEVALQYPDLKEGLEVQCARAEVEEYVRTNEQLEAELGDKSLQINTNPVEGQKRLFRSIDNLNRIVALFLTTVIPRLNKNCLIVIVLCT